MNGEREGPREGRGQERGRPRSRSKVPKEKVFRKGEEPKTVGEEVGLSCCQWSHTANCSFLLAAQLDPAEF